MAALNGIAKTGRKAQAHGPWPRAVVLTSATLATGVPRQEKTALNHLFRSYSIIEIGSPIAVNRTFLDGTAHSNSRSRVATIKDAHPAVVQPPKGYHVRLRLRQAVHDRAAVQGMRAS